MVPSRGQFILGNSIVISNAVRDLSEILPRSLPKVEMTVIALAIESVPSLWVERLVDVAVPEGQPAAERGAASDTPRDARRRGLPAWEGTKARNETRRLCELEDERRLVKIA